MTDFSKTPYPSISTLYPGAMCSFFYVNYKNEREERTVRFCGLDFGHNDWYADPQWFMRTIDVKRNASRSFAFAKIEMDTFKILSDGRRMDHGNADMEGWAKVEAGMDAQGPVAA